MKCNPLMHNIPWNRSLPTSWLICRKTVKFIRNWRFVFYRQPMMGQKFEVKRPTEPVQDMSWSEETDHRSDPLVVKLLWLDYRCFDLQIADHLWFLFGIVDQTNNSIKRSSACNGKTSDKIDNCKFGITNQPFIFSRLWNTGIIAWLAKLKKKVKYKIYQKKLTAEFIT